MRYVNNPQIDEDVLNRAESLFERFLGYSMASKEYEITVKRINNGFPLIEIPVIRIISVEAKTSQTGIHGYGQFFGSTDWTPVSLSDVFLHSKEDRAAITLPPSIFGTPYEEAKIKYLAGLIEIPEEVQDVIYQIAILLKEGSLDEWNPFLPVEILDVIENYKKGGNLVV